MAKQVTDIYLAPKISGILAENVDRNVSVNWRWEQAHNVYRPKSLRKLKRVYMYNVHCTIISTWTK